MDRFLIIRRVGLDSQARGSKVRIIHHRETPYQQDRALLSEPVYLSHQKGFS
jgi:hypothetical protein